jgi:sulfatase maturation enzyme AslB (radical SAM superfamily)
MNTLPIIEGLTSGSTKNTINGNTVINDVKKFQQEYNKYIKNGYNDFSVQFTKLTDSYTKVITDINLKDNVVIDGSHNYIMDNYRNNVQQRQDLDDKLKEVYKTKDSLYNSEYKTVYDATMLSGVLLTILASSLLYYSFSQL